MKNLSNTLAAFTTLLLTSTAALAGGSDGALVAGTLVGLVIGFLVVRRSFRGASSLARDHGFFLTLLYCWFLAPISFIHCLIIGRREPKVVAVAAPQTIIIQQVVAPAVAPHEDK
jgi:hypothetical protein